MPILSIENMSYTYPGGQKAALREENAAFEGGGRCTPSPGPAAAANPPSSASWWDGDPHGGGRRLRGGNLSGGEQQRVGIARSLASGAKVILADEPTGNLDDENTAAIIAPLRKQVTDKSYCVIIVTHDMEVAAACDVCYRMHGGLLTAS